MSRRCGARWARRTVAISSPERARAGAHRRPVEEPGPRSAPHLRHAADLSRLRALDLDGPARQPPPRYRGRPKTRLAAAAAAETADEYADGVCYVDLVPVTNPAQSAATLAAALGLGDHEEAPPAAVENFLADKQLLVLDNCEHLLDGVAGLLEERGQAYVLRVASPFMLTLAPGTKMSCADVVKKLLKDKRTWEVRSAGQGSKGRALVRLGLARHCISAAQSAGPPPPEDRRAGLPLLPRAAGQSGPKARLIRAAGLRWPVEESFELGKGCFGRTSARPASTPRSSAIWC
jgi:hypothetical protein